MADKRRTGFEDAVLIAAKLPWWGSLALALFSYALFHWLTGLQTPPAKGLENLGEALFPQLVKAFAMLLQYVVPAIFGIAAVTAIVKRRSSAALLGEIARRGSSAALLEMDWRDFERVVGEAFRQQGYVVAENDRGGADGGVDLVLTKGAERFLVQCKRWKATMVGVDVVRELYGVMAARGATGAFVVSTGKFSPDARAFAEGRNIELMDAKTLVAQHSVSAAPANPARGCPLCGAPMVERVAKQGARAGQSFLGCSTFPKCRGTRELA